jgi:hypothetical protein
MIAYFVSYSFSSPTGDGLGFGTIELSREHPIRNGLDIRDMCDYIAARRQRHQGDRPQLAPLRGPGVMNRKPPPWLHGPGRRPR